MGMFDYIRCKYPLDVDAPRGGWQTKSLDCTLATYTITPDGRLLDPFGEWMPDFRGEVRFYDYTEAGDWIEFSALFDAGRLFNMKQTSPVLGDEGDAA